MKRNRGNTKAKRSGNRRNPKAISQHKRNWKIAESKKEIIAALAEIENAKNEKRK